MRYRTQVILTIVVIAALLVMRAFQTVVPMATLHAELRRLPAPPQAKLVQLDESGKSPKIFVDYDSPLTRPQIARHYIEVAKRAGWTYCREVQNRTWGRDVGDRSHMFIKGELGIVLFLPGDPKRYGSQYQLTVGKRDLYPWESRECE